MLEYPFFSNPFLEFCLSAPAFSSIILFNMFCSHIWHIENSSASFQAWNPRYSKKGDLPQHLASTFSLVMQFSHESENTKFQVMISLIINLPCLAVGSFLPAITFMWSEWQIPGWLWWPQFFQQQLFSSVPVCPPWQILITLFSWFFKISISFFCVLIWPHQSFHTVCFWIFAAPVIWSILEIVVMFPHQLVSIVQSFFKASSSSSQADVC